MALTLNHLAVTKYRTEAGLKKSELAAKMGRAPSYVTDLEAGRRRNPSATVVRELCNVLGCRPADILVNNDELPAQPNRRAPRDKLVGTPVEVADELGWSPGLIHALIRDGRIPHIKYGQRRVGIPWAALDKWLNDEATASMKRDAS